MKRLPRKAKSAVLTVGDGRGFVVNGRKHLSGDADRLVVTAAHCLPFFPPCCGTAYSEAKTYKGLLAPLGSKPEVWAECLFADPIADIAVLGSPDNQTFYDESDAYDALMESVSPLAIGPAPEKGPGWLLSLEGKWFKCSAGYIKRVDGHLFICNTAQPLMGGMSGSPVLSEEGKAIGLVSVTSNVGDLLPGVTMRCEDEYGVPSPRLVRDLPGWLLRANL